MARAFNLTAQLNIVGPGNLKPIVAKIKRELGTVSANVKVNIDSKSAKSVDIVRARIDALNKSLIIANSNTQNLNASLSSLASSLGKVQSIGAKTGTSINKTSAGMATTAKNIKVATTQIEEFGKQSALAVKRFAAFSIVTTGVVSLIGAISSGFKAFVNFDKEMIKLQQVTGKGAIGLKSLEDQITRLAVSMGVSSESLVDVATTLAQAGLSADETRIALTALAKTELAPSFDNLKDTTEGAIAAFRQFGLQAQDLEAVLGSINAVAAAFAVESSDIIAAIQRTGGVFAASSKGVSEGKDALNEFIAVFTSVRATTRESAETIATGLRTIFTRIQRSRTISLLREFGVELTDLEGKFVGPYEAIKRLSQVLNQLDPRDIRFSGIVEELGGFRQIGKVIPLIQQFATAQQALSVAQKGQNSLSDAQTIAQKSLAVQITKVREQFLALIRDVGKSTSFQALTKIVLGLTSGLISLVGAFKPVLPILGLIGAIKGAGAIGQFATGFFGTLKKGGGLKAFGKNIGSKATGTKDREKNEALSSATSATKENTAAIVALTTAVNNIGSKTAVTGSSGADTSTISTSLDSNTTTLVSTISSLNSLMDSLNNATSTIASSTASLVTSTSNLITSQVGFSTSIDSVGGIMKNVGDIFRSSTDSLYTTMIDLIVVLRDLDNDIKNNKDGNSGLSGGGKVLGFNKGGVVPGNGGGDRIPALLEGGEVVINRKAVKNYGANNLLQMNKQGSKNKKFTQGGIVNLEKLSKGNTREGYIPQIYNDKIQANDIVKSNIKPIKITEKDLGNLEKFRNKIKGSDKGRNFFKEGKNFENYIFKKYLDKKKYKAPPSDTYPLDFIGINPDVPPVEVKYKYRSEPLPLILNKRLRYSIDSKSLPVEKFTTKDGEGPIDLGPTLLYELEDGLKDKIYSGGNVTKKTQLNRQKREDLLNSKLREANFSPMDSTVQRFMAGGKAKETRPFGSGAFPFPKRISNAYFKEIDAAIQKEQVDKAFGGGLGYLEYPKEKRIRVEPTTATETFDATPLDRKVFAESFKRKVSALSIYKDISNFAKFIGLPREDLLLALPEHIDFSGMGGLGPGGQFDRTAMGQKSVEGYDLSPFGYGLEQKQDMYGYEKLVAEKQKELKKILKTPVRTFEDGSFQYDTTAARQTWDDINDLQIRIMQLKKIKLNAQGIVGDQIRETAKKTGRGSVSLNTGSLGFIKNSTLYHELTHQLLQGLRTRSADTFERYKERVVQLFSGDNNDLSEAFDALENSYNSADVVYGRSYKIGLLDQVIQNNRTTSGKMTLTPTAAAEAYSMWGASLGTKKAKEFQPINPKVNQALLDNSIKQNVIDRVEDSGKEEFLTTLVQNADKLNPLLQTTLDDTLTSLLGSAGITRQKYAQGGKVERKIGIIDTDVLRDPANAEIVTQSMQKLGASSVTEYGIELAKLATQARKSSSLSKLTAIAGAAGSGKSSLATGRGANDESTLRKTIRSQILSPDDIAKVNEVIVLTSTLTEEKLNSYLKDVDRAYILSSSTEAEKQRLMTNRANRDLTGEGLYGRKPGAASGAPRDFTLEETTLRDELGKRAMVLGRKGNSFGLRRKRENELPEIVQAAGFFTGGFAPPTAGHKGAFETLLGNVLAKNPNASAKDILVSVAPNLAMSGGEGDTEEEKLAHASRYGIFPADFRTLLAGVNFPGAMISSQESVAGSISKLMEVEGVNGRRRFARTKGASAITSGKDKKVLEKYQRAGLDVTDIPRIDDISATKVRKAVFNGDDKSLASFLDPQIASILMGNRAQLRNRSMMVPMLIEEIKKYADTQKNQVNEDIKRLLQSAPGGPYTKVTEDVRKNAPEVAMQIKNMREQRDRIAKTLLGYRAHNIISLLSSKYPAAYGLDVSRRAQVSAPPADLAKETIAAQIAEGMSGEFGGAPTTLPSSIQQAILEKVTKETAAPKGSGELPTTAKEVLAKLGDKVLPTDPKFGEFSGKKIRDTAKGAKLGYWMSKYPDTLATKPEKLATYEATRDYIKDLYSGVATETTAQALATRTTDVSKSTLLAMVGLYGKNAINGPLTWNLGKNAQGQDVSMSATIMERVLPEQYKSVADYISSQTDITVANAAKMLGKTDPKKLTEKQKGVLNQGNIEGGILEQLLAVLGGDILDDAVRTRAIDFPSGIGEFAANIFGIPADIPTEAKRTISSDSRADAIEEFQRHFRGIYGIPEQVKTMAKGGIAGDDTPVSGYHGSRDIFSKIDASKLGKRGANLYGAGFNIAMDRGMAESYAKKSGAVYPVTVKGGISDFIEANSLLSENPKALQSIQKIFKQQKISVKGLEQLTFRDASNKLTERLLEQIEKKLPKKPGIDANSRFMEAFGIASQKVRELMVAGGIPGVKVTADRSKNEQMAVAYDLERIELGKPLKRYNGGKISKFANGGVLAKVSNGETFVPPKVAKKIGYAKLDQMNKADRNGMQGFAGGGISVFKGPGSGTSDSIGPVSLPVGSYVIREKATKALGLSKGGSVGGIRRFADGGQSKIAGVSVGYLEAVIKEVANLGDSVSASTSSKAMGRLEDLLASAYVEGRVTAESTKKMVNILSALINVTSQSNKESSDKLTKLFDAIDRAQQKRGGTALKRPEEALQNARNKSLERVQKTLEAIGGGADLITDPINIDTGDTKPAADADTERRNTLKEEAAMSAFTSGNSLADVLSAMKDIITEQESNRPSSIEKFKEQFKQAKTPEEKKQVLESVRADKIMADAASKQNRQLINDLNQLIDAENKAGLAAKIAAEETELFASQAKSAGLSQKAYGAKLGQDVLAKTKEKENIEPKRSAFRIAAIEARNKLKTASTDEDKSRIIDSLGSSLQSVLPDATGDQLTGIKEEVGQRLAQGESITDIINSIDLLKKSFNEAVDPLKAFQESVKEVAEATGLSADKIKAEAEQQQKVEKGTEILGKFGGMFPDFAEKFSKNRVGGALVKYGKAANNSEGLGKFVGGKLSGVLGKDLAMSVGTKFGSVVKGIGGPIAAAGVAAKTLGDNLPELYKQFDMAFGTDLRKSNVGAGVAGALSGAGSGAASGALLLSWLGPPGILIGGITGALIGGMQGFFRGFAQKELQNNLEALNKSTVDLDKAFKDMDISNTNESFQKAEKAFGQVTTNAAKLESTAQANTSYFNPLSYISGPSEEVKQEAITARSNAASQNMEAAQRLGSERLKTKTTEEIGQSLSGVRAAGTNTKALNNAYAALAKGSSIVEEYQRSQLLANGINIEAGQSLDQYNSSQAQTIKARAAEQAFLDAYRQKQIQSGRSAADVEQDIVSNRTNAIRQGKIVVGENEALLRKQIELSRATKQLQSASASLLDVFRRVIAGLQKLSAEREAYISGVETRVNTLTGNAQGEQYFDPNARILGNMSAYTPQEVQRAATEASGLIGSGAEGQKVANAAIASKVIQDELPAILRNTEGLDADGVMNKIEEAVSMSLGGMDLSSEGARGVRQILDEMRKNIDQQIQSRQAGSLQDIDVSESLGVVSDTAQKAAEILQQAAQEYEKTINQFTRLQDQANQKYTEAANYARQASTIRLNAELELAKASGKTLSFEEANKPFETEIKSMTSGIFGGVGSTDPVAIAAQIQQKTAEQDALLQDVNQRRANRQTITGGDPQKLKEFDAQLAADTDRLRKNKQALNEANNGLKRLAEDSSSAANAMEAFQANQRAIGAGVDTLEGLLTQNPEEMQNTNRQLEAFRMVQTGAATQGQLNNFQFRQDATAGQKMFTSLLPEDMQRKVRADSIRKMLQAGDTDLNQKIAVGAGGEAITIEDALKRYENPELDPAAKAALDAANLQATAAEQLSRMATEAGDIFLESANKMFDASLNIMSGLLGRSSAEANASLDRAAADATKPKTGNKPTTNKQSARGPQDQGEDADFNVSQDVATSRAVVAGSTVAGAAAVGTGLYAGAPAAQRKAADVVEAAKKSKAAKTAGDVVEAAKGTKAGKRVASVVDAVTESGTGKTTGKAIKTGWETLSAFLPKKYRRVAAVGGALVGGAAAYNVASDMTKDTGPIVDQYGNLPGEAPAPTTPMPVLPDITTETPVFTTTPAPFGIEPATFQPTKVAVAEQTMRDVAVKKPAKKKKPKETRSQALDWLQTGLDVAGLVPVIGELADVANAGIYATRAAASTDKSVAQDLMIDSGLSVASAIPIGGYAANAVKFGRKGLKMAAGATVNAGVNYSTNMAADRFRPQEAAAEAQSVPQPTTRAANARVTTPVTPVSTTPASIPQISPLDSLGPVDLSEGASRRAVEQEISRLSSESQTAAQNRLTSDSFIQAASQTSFRPGMTRWESAAADAQELSGRMTTQSQPVPTSTPVNAAYTAQVVASDQGQQTASAGINEVNITKLIEFGSTFNTTISSFGTYVDKLSKITFPDKIEIVMVGPTKPIEVNITGAAAFEQLEKSTKDLVDTIVANGIGQEVQKMKTDLSKLTGGDYRSPAATGKNR